MRAHLDLRAAVSVPMHYGTFRLADEGFDEPLRDLAVALDVHGLTSRAFHVLDVGQTAVLGASHE